MCFAFSSNELLAFHIVSDAVLHDTHLPEVSIVLFCYCEMHLPHVNVSRVNTARVAAYVA